MSQEKVNQKKYDKTHRKSILRKKKLEEALSLVVVFVIGVAIVGWIGFSIYTKVQSAKEDTHTHEYVEVNTSALQDYMSTVDTEEE